MGLPRNASLFRRPPRPILATRMSSRAPSRDLLFLSFPSSPGCRTLSSSRGRILTFPSHSPASPPPGMRLPLHHAEVPVITNIRPTPITPPLRRHPINRTSLRIRRMRTLTSEQDKSHQQKRHRNDPTSDRQLGTCPVPVVLCAEPSHRRTHPVRADEYGS